MKGSLVIGLSEKKGQEKCKRALHQTLNNTEMNIRTTIWLFTPLSPHLHQDNMDYTVRLIIMSPRLVFKIEVLSDFFFFKNAQIAF